MDKRLLTDEWLDKVFQAACTVRGLDADTMLKTMVDDLLEEHQPELAEVLAQ